MIKIINGDAKDYIFSADMIFTDPPFDLSGKKLNDILKNYNADHLLLITVMPQFLDFMKYTDYIFCLDFVLDTVVPKKSFSVKQPNTTHVYVMYLRKKGIKSVFDRTKVQRQDVATKGYYPTIFRAPRDRLKEYGYAKNYDVISDLLGSFTVNSVIDMFAGTGTIAHACAERKYDCVSIEIKKDLTVNLRNEMNFMGIQCE